MVNSQVLNLILIVLLLLQLGKTKVFLRAGQMAELDTRRTEVLGKSASIIQRKVRSYLARQSFVLLRLSAIQIQATCRGLCLFTSCDITHKLNIRYIKICESDNMRCDCRTTLPANL